MFRLSLPSWKRKRRYVMPGGGKLHIKTERKWLTLSLIIFGGLVVLFSLGFGGYKLLHHDAKPHTPNDPNKVTVKIVKPNSTTLGQPIAKLPLLLKPYGIAAGSSLTALDDQTLDRRLKAMSDLGVGWVRYDFDWSLIQPDNAGSYNWSKYDKLVAASRKHNLQVLAILDYTPGWARKSGCGSSQCAPASNAQFANFAAAVTKRYKSKGVRSWEIWNEPNNRDFWKPSSSPAAYADMLKQSYTAIKAQDNAATVITGGLSPQATGNGAYAPLDFLTGVYDNGAQGSFDAVADHPYTFPFSPASPEYHAWNQMAAGTNSLRALMVARGDSQKKMWMTEFGAPTGGPGPVATILSPKSDQHPYVVDEGLQAKILSDALALYKSYDWAGPFFVYTFQDPGTDQSTNENFFGLTRADGSHKPAYDTYAAAIKAYQL